MQVKITRTTVAAKQFVLAGEVHDLPDAEARLLIQIGKAVALDGAEPQPDVLETKDAVAVVSTDTPKRKGRSRVAK